MVTFWKLLTFISVHDPIIKVHVEKFKKIAHIKKTNFKILALVRLLRFYQNNSSENNYCYNEY